MGSYPSFIGILVLMSILTISTSEASIVPAVLSSVLGSSAPCQCSALPAPLPGVKVERGKFQNWVGEIKVDSVWIASPTNYDQVLQLVNYAYNHGYKIRASGYMHSWVPITVNLENDGVLNGARTCPSSSGNDKLILLQTKDLLTDMQLINSSSSMPSLRTQCGASMQTILQFLEDRDFGLTGVPAPGDITIGGAISVGAHGASIPAVGEEAQPGQGYGSLSNLIVAFTAVVWEPSSQSYVLKNFSRSDPEAKAFLVALGRTLILEVTLRVIPNYNLQCVSYTDIPAAELFADPNAASTSASTRTFSSFLNDTGRAEAILFPFTANPWLKVWRVAEDKPPTSREVTGPFNYVFSDNFPAPIPSLVGSLAAGNGSTVLLLGPAEYEAAVNGLAATGTSDIWGKSKNTLLYIKPTTLRLKENGAAILTNRKNVQQIVFESFVYYQGQLQYYKELGLYPSNGPLEVRVCGLDEESVVGVENAESPGLSAMNPKTPLENNDYDVVVWFNILCFPNTPRTYEFSNKMETFFYEKYNGQPGSIGLIRTEWSKGWAFTDSDQWANADRLRNLIPASFPATWNFTVATLNKYDPKRVFTNTFLDSFLV